MADLEDVTLDGKPLHSLRVADLKAALEERGLPKSGQKNALIKRLKGALMLENLQRTSTPHIGLQPNSQIGEEMSQNSFIKQYLAKQQELLRQRLEREAREAAEANEMGSQAAPEEEDHEVGNLASCRVQEDGGRGDMVQQSVVPVRDEVENAASSAPSVHPGLRRSLIQQTSDRHMEDAPAFVPQAPLPGPQESRDAPGGMVRRSASARLSHEELSAVEPPRAVASISVRVLGEPESEGPAALASASSQPTHQLGSSARTSGLGQEQSDDDSDEDEEWGVGRPRRGPSHAPAPGGLPFRSRRKQQPPQHIPPPQIPHQPPLQLRQPTPPPSPPPELAYHLPDTPKQSPPNPEEAEAAGAAAEGQARSPSALQRQDSSSSSSGSSSPEPPQQRRPGPLTLLARKMESEGAFGRVPEGQGSTVASGTVSASTPATGSEDSVALPPRSEPAVITGNSVAEAEPGAAATPARDPVTFSPAVEASSASSALEVFSVSSAGDGDVKAKSEKGGEGQELLKSQESEKADMLIESRASAEDGGTQISAEERDGRSRLPLRRRGFGATQSPVCQTTGRSSRPLESQPSTALSPPASKKLRFLRDMPQRSQPPTTPPPPQTPQGPSDEPPEAQPSQQPSSPPVAELGDECGRLPAEPLDPVLEKGFASRLVATERGVDSEPSVTPADKQAASKVVMCDAEAEERLDASAGLSDAEAAQSVKEEKPISQPAVEEPTGPVLPPSPPSEEGDAERERRSSPSSDSSSSHSDSESSSSHSSRSSSSRDQSHSTSSRKMADGAERDANVSHPEGRAATAGSLFRKRKGGHPEAHDAEGVSLNKKQKPGEEGPHKEGRKMDSKGLEGSGRVPARELKQATISEPADSAEQVDVPSESGGTGAQPHPDGHRAAESSESRSEESTMPKAFTARKISLNTSKSSLVSVGGSTPTVPPPGGLVEAESGGQAARKRRWGSSTAVTAKKPSISITTDSLKSLIPDIKCIGSGHQEAVVELHAEEGRLSGDEEGAERAEQGDQGMEKGLKIRRTVTQVVPAENQENGQKDQEDEDDDDEEERQERDGAVVEGDKDCSDVAMETQAPNTREPDVKKVTPNDSLVRRSISQQKSGVSVTIDDPVRASKQPSPPRGKVTNIVHICNLVRPFTLGQLKELLNRTGTVLEEGFWIDKIKSHCYVTYSTTEEAVATRAALHGVKWPQSNPKFLSVDFSEQDELDFHRGLLTVERSGEEERPVVGSAPPTPVARPSLLPPLLPERQRERAPAVVRDQWAEREREMERRERTRAEREWDRDKIREFSRPGEERESGARRSRSRDRERRRKERAKSKERKSEKKEKAPEEPPAKLLDDLFRKTKTAPCIYWLPLTEEQIVQRGAERAERMKEREKRRKELQEEEDKKREEERKERVKGRDKEGGAVPSAGLAGGDRDRDKDRARDRDADKRRDAYRSRGADSKSGTGSTGGAAGGRRSRSRSNPPVRERRR